MKQHNPSVYLAIDLGAESGRAIIGELGAEHLELHEVHRFTNQFSRQPGGLHWDVIALWNNVLEGLRQGAAWSAERGLPLISVGVDAWGVDFALLSSSGELLDTPHCYRDEANIPAFKKALAAFGGDFIYAATGIQLMPINTLFQLIARRDADPDLLDRADRLLFMPDLMHYFLTGHAAVEATIASTSQMVDPHTGAWAESLLEKTGLPTRMLGTISPSGTRLGALRPEVASQADASPSVEVIIPASHDTASAVAAVPADGSSSWCFLSSGTWSLIGAELERPCITDAAREASFTNERGVGNTIRFLKNISGLWLLQECRRDFEAQGPAIGYDQLTAAAASAEPFRTLVNPNHQPFWGPGQMPRKIIDFARSTGQAEPADIGQLVRCCLESLALAYRHTLDHLERILGRRFDVMHIVGGGSRNTLLNQMTADATGRRVLAGPQEATAMGNLLVQAMGHGRIPDRSSLRHIVAQTVRPQVYEPRATADWDQVYPRFAELL
ncbi:MAG TPA: rhamnulokinase family protein [Phycisphaerae bacterium]|nr:rhamnulokinase family protein [Phycisphaerae bacterium]